MENLNRQLDKLGSQRKVSVSVPKLREKPNLAFKAPTYNLKDSRFLSTRQGGSHNPAAAGLFLIFLALAGKINRIRIRIIIDLTGRLYSPVNPVRKLGMSFLSNGVNNILSYCIFLKTLPFMGDLNGVYPIDTKNLHKFILPSE